MPKPSDYYHLAPSHRQAWHANNSTYLPQPPCDLRIPLKTNSWQYCPLPQSFTNNCYLWYGEGSMGGER